MTKILVKTRTECMMAVSRCTHIKAKIKELELMNKHQSQFVLIFMINLKFTLRSQFNAIGNNLKVK